MSSKKTRDQLIQTHIQTIRRTLNSLRNHMVPEEITNKLSEVMIDLDLHQRGYEIQGKPQNEIDKDKLYAQLQEVTDLAQTLFERLEDIKYDNPPSSKPTIQDWVMQKVMEGLELRSPWQQHLMGVAVKTADGRTVFNVSQGEG